MLPPSIEAIAREKYHGECPVWLREIVHRIAYEAARLQREADEAIARSYDLRFRIRNAPLVVAEPKQGE